MKRLVCLLLIVPIAFAGCYDVEIDKLTDLPISDKPTEVPKQNKGSSKATQTSGFSGWMNDWDIVFFGLGLKVWTWCVDRQACSKVG